MFVRRRVLIPRTSLRALRDELERKREQQAIEQAFANRDDRSPMHPRPASTLGGARGGSGLELVLDYRFIDVTRYFLKGEAYNRRHPGGEETLSGLDPANNAKVHSEAGWQRRPPGLSVHFLEWTIGRGCTLWCVALPTSIGWTAQDWMLFLVPKGPQHRARGLIDFDFKSLRRYVLDPPRWSPAFLYAPVEETRMEQVVDFRSPDAFEIYLKEPHPPARLLTQTAGAPRPTVLVVLVPDDQGGGQPTPFFHLCAVTRSHDRGSFTGPSPG